MGYMRHHAIVVSSWDGAALDAAHQKAVELLGILASAIVLGHANGFRSFFIAPDGSKEGWEASDDCDAARESFIDYLKSQAYDDGSSILGWVEVQFADDERETKVTHSSDEEQAAK